MIQEQFLLHRNLFNLTVSLNSETSERLGHPVVSMDYWGQSYLCDSQWSQNEAKVMCRELGFATGAKFYKSKISQKISQSFSPNLGKFQCLGNEATLSECKSLSLMTEIHVIRENNIPMINIRMDLTIPTLGHV